MATMESERSTTRSMEINIPIEKGSRVGQFLMFEAETLSMYDGDYGIGKEHDKKYGN